MQVLIPDDRRSQRDCLRHLIQRESEVQVSGIAEEAENAPEDAMARELRRALDGCPVCDGSYRDPSYSILATIAIAERWQSPLRVKQYYDCLQAPRGQDLLRIREWDDAADTLIGFAFRCSVVRVGIVTILGPCEPGLPDTPLHYTILPEEEGNRLLSFPSGKVEPAALRRSHLFVGYRLYSAGGSPCRCTLLFASNRFGGKSSNFAKS